MSEISKETRFPQKAEGLSSASSEPEKSLLLGFEEMETTVETLLLELQQQKQGLIERQKAWMESQQEAQNTILEEMAERETRTTQALEDINARWSASDQALQQEKKHVEEIQQHAKTEIEEVQRRAKAEQERQDAFREVWKATPLPLRLKFLRELLAEEHPYQPSLKEITSLEDLRQRGRDFEAWITQYPSLFVEAIGNLEIKSVPERSARILLTEQTLREARQTIETNLKAMGLEWVAPKPGEAITETQEVVGEEKSENVEVGTVARLRRPGFRLQGKLLLPAQVLRAVSSGAASAAVEVPPTQEATVSATPSEVRSAQETLPPDWLRTLQQRCMRCELRPVQELLGRLTELAKLKSPSEEVLRYQLEPLLPLLGSRYAATLPEIPAEQGEMFIEAREGLMSWLQDAHSMEVSNPQRGEPFVSQLMESVGTRPTVLTQEDNRVMRTERVGILYQGKPLIRAKVHRFVMQ